jgi:hypothetical protein
MARTSKEEVFREAIALKTFNSTKGRDIESKAGKALRNIPKSVDRDVLKKTYLRFAEESPQNLWFAINRTKAEHFDVLCEALEEHGGFQARFLLEAMKGRGAQQRFERFMGAAELVHIASRFDGAGQVGALPSTEKEAKLLRPFAKNKRILAAARSALRGADDEHDRVYTRGLYWNLAGVLAQAGDKESIALLEVLADVFLEGDDWDVQQLQLVLAASNKASAAKVAHRIETELTTRQEGSAIGRWAKAVGVPVPEGKYWQISLQIQTGAKYTYRARPEARLELEALTPPRWRIRVEDEKGRKTEFYEDGTFDNDLKLERPDSPLYFGKVLEQSANVLGVKWNPASVDIFMSGVRKGKPLVKKWVAAQL